MENKRYEDELIFGYYGYYDSWLNLVYKCRELGHIRSEWYLQNMRMKSVNTIMLRRHHSEPNEFDSLSSL